MKQQNDAYGHELMDFFKTGEGHELVEKDDGFISVGKHTPAKYFSEYKDWPRHEKMAIKFAKGKILDIGCGAGRVVIYLQSKGFDVIGIDNSPLAVKLCKQRGLKKVKVLSIDEINKFGPHIFDTIIMFGNNFGLFGSREKAKTLLEKIARITSSNARIVAESLNPHLADDPSFKKYQKHNVKLGRMPGQMRFRIRYNNYIGSWFDYLMVSKKEMKEVLKGTEWKIMKFIDHENKTTGAYIAVLEKKFH